MSRAPRKPRPYHLLLERDGAAAPWCIAFGAFDRADVTAEREDMRDHGSRASDLRIVTAPDAKRATVEALVAGLNAPPETPGSRAYAEDVRRCPTYPDGGARAPWSTLEAYVRESWERNPTPRDYSHAWPPVAPAA